MISNNCIFLVVDSLLDFFILYFVLLCILSCVNIILNIVWSFGKKTIYFHVCMYFFLLLLNYLKQCWVRSHFFFFFFPSFFLPFLPSSAFLKLPRPLRTMQPLHQACSCGVKKVTGEGSRVINSLNNPTQRGI